MKIDLQIDSAQLAPQELLQARHKLEDQVVRLRNDLHHLRHAELLISAADPTPLMPGAKEQRIKG